ncbi:histone acetyltransferase subunit NuA4-domain-containing protein [Kickxella alabastrina]|uniref:histone acetyltransferase subunit NuA4-domain-containing protein n=1 Tax=Kickxella alabastrina TaxID=61397 RepID=UPI0022200697|nr:histone acetyltransferase subunit NuA4-domain-containing protein [Kickxella alabastrina]KAI7832923.1 histone acetyltransferase subunit NuA4-domain-containing protein [Kickxella alabastrina]
MGVSAQEPEAEPTASASPAPAPAPPASAPAPAPAASKSESSPSKKGAPSADTLASGEPVSVKSSTPAPASATKLNKSKTGEGKVTKKMLKEAEQELYQILLKKKQLDRQLIDTESSIYDFETSYFENCGQEGNIVHGFEGYLTSGRHHEQRRGGNGGAGHFGDADRIFSQSSATFKKAQEAKIAASLLDSDTEDEDDSGLVQQARNTTGTGGSAGGVKRKAVGGSTIKHNASGRQGTPTGRSTPTPSVPRTTKKLRLSIESGT